MKVVNFGSLNIDHVYAVDHFVSPGETISDNGYSRFCGGKGCNQSVALANANQEVIHAGAIGSDGDWVKDRLFKSGADVSQIMTCEPPTGHAIIQVTPNGENAIIVSGGANRCLTVEYVLEVLAGTNSGDYVLTQNETNCVPEILDEAFKRGLYVVFNPAPYSAEVKGYPLNNVNLLILNETEASALTDEKEPDRILDSLMSNYPHTDIVLTLGAQGAKFVSKEMSIYVEAPKVEAVDTTGAGDTFIGYFVAELAAGGPPKQSLEIACKAASICVQKAGATDSIPERSEI